MKTDTRRVAIGLIVLVGCCQVFGHASTHGKPGARARILGAWQLESRTVRTANGDIVLDPVLGKQPLGRLFYDASGHMMLQMITSSRRPSGV